MMSRYSVRSSTNPAPVRRSDRGEGLSVVTQLDVELAGVGLLVFASRTGVLHDEARHRTNRSQIHLQEQGPVFSAPSVGLASRHAAVHRLLRPLIRAARHTSSGGTMEREVHAAIRPVDLELVNPGHRLPAVGRTGDIQADEAGFDGRLDHVGGRPRISGALPDAPAPRRPAFLGRLSQPLLHVVGRFSVADAVHQGRGNHAAPGKPLAPELRLETVPEEDHRGQERQPVDPERAPGEEGTPELDLCDRPRLPGPTPIEGSGGPSEESWITTHRRSDTRTTRQRSRRPAPHSRSCGRRARSVRAHARTAHGPGSSPACRAGRRSA